MGLYDAGAKPVHLLISVPEYVQNNGSSFGTSKFDVTF